MIGPMSALVLVFAAVFSWSAPASPDASIDLARRLELARQMAEAGRLDDAIEELVRLWDATRDDVPETNRVRLSLLSAHMRRLARVHSPAKARFTELRDRYGPSIEDGTASSGGLIEWVRLNEVIGDQDATLAWYEDVRDDSEAARRIAPVERELFALLAQRKRWVEAGRVVRDPVARAQEIVTLNARVAQTEDLKRQPPSKRAMIERYQTRRFRRGLMDLYAACLAADRDRQAEGVAVILLREYGDGVARLELVQIALMADKPRTHHREWLDGAEALGEPDAVLRAELELALERSNSD